MNIKSLASLAKLGLFNISCSLNFPILQPDVLQISITSRCNLGCKMCSVNKYTTSEEEEMTLEEVKKIINIAKKHFRIKELILTGGEPLLVGEKAVEVSKFAHQKDIKVTLTTNGYFLKEYAYRLTEAGVSHFHISVDGLRDTHNYLRGNPESFDRVIESIKFLAEVRQKYNYKYSIGIAMLVLKKNINEIYDLYNCCDELGVNIFDLLAYLPDNTEFSNTNATYLWPDAEDIERFVNIYKKIVATNANCTKLNTYFNAELLCKYYKRIMQSKDWRCFAGFKNFFITMSDPKRQGRLEPCLFMCKTHIPLRDYDYNLKKMWYSYRAYKARIAIRRCKTYCYQMCFSLPSFRRLLRNK
ncbi:radical SAM protein [Patescibacteria group bacterium]|nr:radical SAM protein [Patescibacteria group bacterium]